MAKREITMPRFGAQMQKGEILSWNVKVGDHVEEDDELAEIKAEKMNASCDSLYEGTILELVPVGTVVEVGGVIGYIDEEED